MKHASDSGALPANVEQQRTRVSVDQDAPRHTSTVEYAGAYYGSGVDNSFSMERFARDFKIEVKSLDEEEMVFDMIGIDPAIANAFRRILNRRGALGPRLDEEVHRLFRQVEDLKAVPCRDQVTCHRAAHIADPDKSHFRHFSIFPRRRLSTGSGRRPWL